MNLDHRPALPNSHNHAVVDTQTQDVSACLNAIRNALQDVKAKVLLNLMSAASATSQMRS